ncbi:MAG: bifunctional 5,10-methylene-tetrahydrofolate dehydrogenase/5,10-methylene-tetrahydrofolate cyclohydrolase, partial [Firmicutes bacterium]|nr:bifunctional 5,10-methylene-tetrahydrofolate dehydrogenase/5,10-methylene-tetrahydrofolate cyclohydrolase [Bacillota bacterium]
VVVLGRSLVVGKPVAMLLLREHATVTICHSRTENLPEVCRQADLLVAAVGRAKMVNADYVKPGQIVIDVGINEDPDNPGKYCGDVDFASVEPIVDKITPVPGGVGSVTTAVLCKHTIMACQLQRGL